jgi:ketosteroid isomerase-like protein
MSAHLLNAGEGGGGDMGAKENADLVRRGYAAFSAGDMATLTEVFAEDAVWHVPGDGGLAGDKKGRDACFAYFGELFSRSGGTVRVDLHDVVGGEEHTIGLHHVHAERNGRVLDDEIVLVFHLRDGRVGEVWEIAQDAEASNDFWP